MMRNLTFLALVLVLMTPAPGLAADTTQDRFAAANQAWFDNDRETACASYGKLLDELGNVPQLHYNLGLCAYHRDRFGLAVYHFEKVVLADGPLSAAARTSLDVTWKALQARYKTQIEKGIYRYDSGHGMGYAIFTLLPETLALVLFLVFALPLLAALFFWTFSRRQALVATGRIAFLSCLLPALLFGVLYFGQLGYRTSHTFAIVTAPEALLLEAPDPKAPSAPLPEGLQVRILLRNEQGFYKIQRGGSETGYVHESQVNVL